MAFLQEHEYDCRRILCREWTEVHLRLDALFIYKKHGAEHRRHRHHKEGVEEVRQQWGDEAAIAAKIHTLIDCLKNIYLAICNY